ncbi:MAG: mono/diheme cytochrome c family protein [Alphaproteobacteria bacterium]|jgi:mono/diheme cytochrome c family protein
MTERFHLGLAGVVMILASTVGPLMADEVQSGKELAERWCSRCHVVAPELPPGGAAPSFAKLANTILLSETYLDTQLRDPHPSMQRFQLTPSMVSDLMAYLRSLKK